MVIDVKTIIFRYEEKIKSAKEYIKTNADAIDVNYFIEQIPIWEEEINQLRKLTGE